MYRVGGSSFLFMIKYFLPRTKYFCTHHHYSLAQGSSRAGPASTVLLARGWAGPGWGLE